MVTKVIWFRHGYQCPVDKFIILKEGYGFSSGDSVRCLLLLTCRHGTPISLSLSLSLSLSPSLSYHQDEYGDEEDGGADWSGVPQIGETEHESAVGEGVIGAQ